ncbi:MAG: glycosyltransferase family 1 protein [Erysipelotrichia bacterium]|nr:glycosyltransferase family 1 protein [Erysipelotrichia bacterium]
MDNKKILIVMGGSSMGFGGIESMVMNYYRWLDKDKVQVDFVFFGEGKGLYDEELLENGSRLFHLPIKSKNYLKSKRKMKELLLREKYDVMHANLNAAGILSAMKIGKKCGIPVRIAHAHSTNHGTTNRVKWLINDISRKKISKYSTDNFACSDLAGKWYFSNRKFQIINNAIEVEKYIFDMDKRKKVRNQYNAGSKYIVGHVGSLGYPKNQEFLLYTFSEIFTKNANSELWIVGEGNDLGYLKEKAVELGIDKKIIFMGKRNDVNDILQGMDIFVLPSLFEGFPVVVVEAVASGLPCVISDTITKTAAISNQVRMLDLEMGAEKWAEAILKFNGTDREYNYDLITVHGFNIKNEAKKMQNFYCQGRFE